MGPDIYSDLRELTKSFTILSDSEWESLADLCSKRRILKGEYFVKHGEACETLAFVSSGLLKTFYIDRDGKEYIKSFATQGSFTGPLSSIVLNIPSMSFIQALENSEIYELNYKKLDELYNASNNCQTVGRKIIEQVSIKRDIREYELLTLCASERLSKLESDNPKWLNRVSKGNLASYLGISPVSLSRLYRSR